MEEVALITGASSGLGKDFSYIHASKNRDLVLVARRLDKLKEIKKDLEDKYNVNVVVIKKDLSKEKSCDSLFKYIIDNDIKVKYLINNAGFGGVGKFYERDINEEVDMINVNITTLTKLTRLFLPEFIKNNEGYILNLSSIASLMPGPNQAVYFATKSYVTSFSNAVNEELKGTNVSITTILPGPTKTEFGEKSKLDDTSLFDKAASSYDVAKEGYKAMIDRKLNKIVGVSLIQRIGLSLIKFMPKKLVLKVVNKLQQLKDK